MLSMTGYGSGESQRGGKKINVLASSINRKQADFRISLPRELQFLEQDCRESVSKQINRGAVNVLVEFCDAGGDASETQINMALARSCWEKLQVLRRELQIQEEPTLRDLLVVPDIFTLGAPPLSEEALREMCLEALDKALDGVMATRAAEGRALQADILDRRNTLVHLLDQIKQLAPRVPRQYRERLTQRLAECNADLPIDEERLLREVMLYADRADISEEITRLLHHLDQMRELLDADGVIGRRVDFLIQEQVREINTIGSKCSDKDIAQHVVHFKTELERIREQVQNIE